MKIINVFCDASIDTNKHIACGGCYITIQEIVPEVSIINGYRRDTVSSISIKDYCSKMYIQHNATNNSAEILAIWTGIQEIIRIREMYPNAIYRVFSDSKISLYGLRDWMKNWINRYDPEKGVLISSSGEEVANQQYFIEIYNLIIELGLKVEFYHQRGHVGESGGVSLIMARTQFIKANKVPPVALGLSIEELVRCNHMIDNNTRVALKHYINSNGVLLDNTYEELIHPLRFYPIYERLDDYIHNINKTSVVSRHDFKGGYNQ